MSNKQRWPAEVARMVARHGEWYTALRLLIQKLDADGPERAVENMQRAVDLLQSGRNHGAPQ